LIIYLNQELELVATELLVLSLARVNRELIEEEKEEDSSTEDIIPSTV